MPEYQITITVNVPDVEADTPDEAIQFVRSEIESVFDVPVRFYAESAVNYDEK